MNHLIALLVLVQNELLSDTFSLLSAETLKKLEFFHKLFVLVVLFLCSLGHCLLKGCSVDSPEAAVFLSAKRSRPWSIIQ